jgi:hypothetical protein
MLSKANILNPPVIILIVLSLFVSGISFSADTVELIKNSRKQIAAISQTFYNGNRPDKQSLNTLSTTVSSLLKTSMERFPNQIRRDTIFTHSLSNFDSLNRRFEKLSSANTGVDILRSAFKDLKWSFINLFTEYFYADGTASKNNKVILFSTSVSCKCVMKMCEEQEHALHLLQSSYNGKLDVIVIDVFYHNDLKEKHDVLLLPTVIVLDENSKEMKRMVYENNIYEKVKAVID